MRYKSIKCLSVSSAITVLALAVPATATAYSFDVDIDNNSATKETFEIYGTVRLSADYGDSDLGSAPENKSSGLTDGSFGISSNTTILGLRGSYALEEKPYSVVWQVEQVFRPDTDGGETFGTRDTFLGVKTPVGLFRVGHLDTPFKVMGLRNALFVTTVADPMAILGKSSQSGVRLDLRAQNAIKWDHSFNGLEVSALYSLDGQRGDEGSTDAYIDNSDDGVFSLSLGYKLGPVMMMGAFEDWTDAWGGGISAWRTGARYNSGPITLGAIYGNIDADDEVAGGSLSRSEYGAYLSYKLTPKVSVAGQWMHADESDLALGNDGADQYSVGVHYFPFGRLILHAVATITDNDDHGKYGSADFAHGDRIATVAGGSPRAVSVGAQLSF